MSRYEAIFTAPEITDFTGSKYITVKKNTLKLIMTKHGMLIVDELMLNVLRCHLTY